MEGTWAAQFVDALTPEVDEPVVVKYTHDCFYRTEMEPLLDRLRNAPGRKQNHRHRDRGARLCADCGDGIQRERLLRVRTHGVHSAERRKGNSASLLVIHRIWLSVQRSYDAIGSNTL